MTDTLSLDALKKTPGFISLPIYFAQTYGSSFERLDRAKRNFCASLAAYSLFSYILLIKDRHNGSSAKVIVIFWTTNIFRILTITLIAI